jgi:HSP20 family protein
MYESILNYPGSVFGEFDRLRRELDGLFQAGDVPASIRSVAAGSFPAVNVGRTPTSVEIYAFAPGLDTAKTEITLDRGVLRISGERAPKVPNIAEGVNVYANERASGRFTRAVALPDEVDPDKVAATYRDGVLQVSVALRASAQPRRISLN